MKKLLVRDAILRIGVVSGIDGRKIYISVDKNKNSSDLLFDGEIIKNISVGGYVEIRKGFLSIIGKADGERLKEENYNQNYSTSEYKKIDRNKRILTISLSGYIEQNGKFVGGIKELPLIGNEAFILTSAKVHKIHNLLKSSSFPSIRIAKTAIEDIPVDLPIDGLFNSHIAIFGNTGSGKSNTLAILYQELFRVLSNKESFSGNCRFLLFDFNGEYSKLACITDQKKIYNLSTHADDSDTIPILMEELLDVETLSVLVEATEKTQKPFLKRTLRFFKNSLKKEDFPSYLKKIVQNKIVRILQMANKDVALKLLDYMEVILNIFVTNDDEMSEMRSEIIFHSVANSFFVDRPSGRIFFGTDESVMENAKIFEATNNISASNLDRLSILDQFFIFLHLQLAGDLLQYKVQNDHIYPVINRFRAKRQSIERVFRVNGDSSFWDGHNFVVVNLRNVNLDMRKTIPLLLAKNIYSEHKRDGRGKTLNIIVDEAHNILSKVSFRETDEWKDYRLETFEEIIKEGRKFGVFMTIASQRPNDISDTIISQAHNYFIHQLVNQKDLIAISKAVSYIDKITEESIPTLAVGTCVFSGIATPMPLKLCIEELPDNLKPDSHTLKFEDVTTRMETIVDIEESIPF